MRNILLTLAAILSMTVVANAWETTPKTFTITNDTVFVRYASGYIPPGGEVVIKNVIFCVPNTAECATIPLSVAALSHGQTATFKFFLGNPDLLTLRIVTAGGRITAPSLFNRRLYSKIDVFDGPNNEGLTFGYSN